MVPDDQKEARAYVWGYFALHAEQRMKLFSFFLILSGLILGAFPAVRQMAPESRLVGFLPFLLVLTSLTFWRLDERTRRLLQNAEAALRFLDAQWPVEPSADGGPHVLQLVERDDYLMNQIRESRWTRLVPMTYTASFRIAYLMIGGVGLVLTAWVVMR